MIDPLDPATLMPAREKLQLSRATLAAMSGVNETTILRIETGKADPRLDGTWAPIVRAIRSLVSPDETCCSATPTPSPEH